MSSTFLHRWFISQVDPRYHSSFTGQFFFPHHLSTFRTLRAWHCMTACRQDRRDTINYKMYEHDISLNLDHDNFSLLALGIALWHAAGQTWTLHPKKAWCPISTSSFKIFRFRMLQQPLNAFLPIFATDIGSVIWVNEVQRAKVNSSMWVTCQQENFMA